MSKRLVTGLSGGLACLLVASLSHAQCSKDTDCKGERVCEAGACVDASPPPSATPTPPPAAAAQPLPAAAPLAPPPAAEEREPMHLADPKPPRHSTGMMVGGIVMTSLVPIALLVAWSGDINQNTCENGGFVFGSDTVHADSNCSRYDKTIYGGLISAAVLAGVGIPLIIVGARREPRGTAALVPWTTRTSAGLTLRLEL